MESTCSVCKYTAYKKEYNVRKNNELVPKEINCTICNKTFTNYNKYTRLVILKYFASALEQSFSMTTYREPPERRLQNTTFRHLYFQYQYGNLNIAECGKFNIAFAKIFEGMNPHDVERIIEKSKRLSDEYKCPQSESYQMYYSKPKDDVVFEIVKEEAMDRFITEELLDQFINAAKKLNDLAVELGYKKSGMLNYPHIEN